MSAVDAVLIVAAGTAILLAAMAGLAWLVSEIIWWFRARPFRHDDEVAYHYADGRIIRASELDTGEHS